MAAICLLRAGLLGEREGRGKGNTADKGCSGFLWVDVDCVQEEVGRMWVLTSIFCLPMSVSVLLLINGKDVLI